MRISSTGPVILIGGAEYRLPPTGPVVDGYRIGPTGPFVSGGPEPPPPGPVVVPPAHEWGFSAAEATMDLTGEPPGEWALDLSPAEPAAYAGRTIAVTAPAGVTVTFEGAISAFVDDTEGAYLRTYVCTVREVPTTDNTVVWVVAVEQSVTVHDLAGIYSYLAGTTYGTWSIETVAPGLGSATEEAPLGSPGPFEPVDRIGLDIPEIAVALTQAAGYERTSLVALDNLEALVRVEPAAMGAGGGVVVWQTGLGDAPRPTPAVAAGGFAFLLGQNGEGGTETNTPLIAASANRINGTLGTWTHVRQSWGVGAWVNDVPIVGPVSVPEAAARAYLGTANEGGFQATGAAIAEVLGWTNASVPRLAAWRRHGRNPAMPGRSGTIAVVIGASDTYFELAAQLIAAGEVDTVLRFAVGGETVTGLAAQVLAVRQVCPWLRQYEEVRIYLGAGIISNEWVAAAAGELSALYEAAALREYIRFLCTLGRLYWLQHTFRRTSAPPGGRAFTLTENQTCHLLDVELCAREQIALVPWVHSVLLPGEWERTIAEPAPVAFPDRVHWTFGACAETVVGPIRSARQRWH